MNKFKKLNLNFLFFETFRFLYSFYNFIKFGCKKIILFNKIFLFSKMHILCIEANNFKQFYLILLQGYISFQEQNLIQTS